MSFGYREEAEVENFVLYRDRPEWSDVCPLPQDDGPVPVVAISYSDKFRDVYDYFRAVLKADERSERALTLTEDAIKLNPANYTVWEYRRRIIQHLKKDLSEELKVIEETIEDNPKNYQVWHHRLRIVDQLDNPGNELEFSAKMIQLDSKNYHAWHYRQWILNKFHLFEGELTFVEWLLQEDLRNNSAWNQRYFVLSNTTGFTRQVLHTEIDFVIQAILKVKKNESAWNYLRGILEHSEEGLLESKVSGFCEELYKRGCRSPFLIGFLADSAALRMVRDPTARRQHRDSALEYCKELAEKHDVIRKNYWNYYAKNSIELVYKQLDAQLDSELDSPTDSQPDT